MLTCALMQWKVLSTQKKKKKADSSKSISPQKIYIYNLNFAKVII